ncbi:MAG: virulence protein RhuM/Fic/DOC family protein [Candidatus Marinimicrobia bacterium]|jgi:prophage maintenance system killer protein|nr:virulence protein RhuM/Fic/DOC family protein [Candidatus Neomarinimicrobiota bacterium]MBT6470991.1 virulence protein RhuM/Fic/DOC family protein [Candidatus Neomarinimicrobiota bacterium]MBT6937562.1 virulence protein RhuM/Fic/DOC family protein [Candidatus Neomarinimicrobiota bacterium]MBT7269843.1 virulence protein RhuM/Fic/DOC family protein [Candidatus Neomarinimicrobiota bacterium]
MDKENSIIIYKQKGLKPEIEVKLEDDTVWLNQKLLSELFDKDTDTIGLHIRNIIKEGELSEKATTEHFSVVQIEGKRKVKRKIKFYNLDMIISVGYRVKSKTATQFRIWATNTLRDHLVKGYTINEKRLQQQAQKYQELQNSVKLLENVLALDEITQDQARGIIEVVTDYAYALDILDQYDFKNLSLKKVTKKEHFKLNYETAIKLINNLKKQFGGSDIFGVPKDESFQSSVAAIYQSAGGKDAYPSVEEKAAHLLYFVTKNHSFVDGNKRIAATLFVYFLNQNKILYRKDGSKRLPDTTLVALTVLIAQSKPEEMETIIKVIVNLINKNII